MRFQSSESAAVPMVSRYRLDSKQQRATFLRNRGSYILPSPVARTADVAKRLSTWHSWIIPSNSDKQWWQRRSVLGKARTRGSTPGSPHSPRSSSVRGKLGSSIAPSGSRNGDCMSAAPNSPGARFSSAPSTSPPADVAIAELSSGRE
eukprot:scaffold159858_cov31-Tisochrysis_lutea.AAC.3